MTTYVVRSMTTTDYIVGTNKPVVPYHVYLKPQSKRGGAYWTSFLHEAMKFESPQEAAEEIRRCLPSNDGAQVALADGDMPSYWELLR